MGNGNMWVSSNFQASNNNRIEKKVCTLTCAAGSALVIFVGASVLRVPAEGGIVPEYDFQRISCIDYVNLDKEGFVGTDANKAVDLLKLVNLDKIKKLAIFKDDWNGTGGSPFSEGAVSLFEKVIHMLIKQPQIAPTGRNSLLLQYELDDKSLLAFEVGEKRTEKVYIPQGDYSLVQTDSFSEHIGERINECVECFYGFT